MDFFSVGAEADRAPWVQMGAAKEEAGGAGRVGGTGGEGGLRSGSLPCRDEEATAIGYTEAIEMFGMGVKGSVRRVLVLVEATRGEKKRGAKFRTVDRDVAVILL